MSQTYVMSLREKYAILLHSIVLESLITYDIILMIINLFVCKGLQKKICSLCYGYFSQVLQAIYIF